MSTVRNSSLALVAVLASGLAVTLPAMADATPSAPDYLFQLPERQWIVGGACNAERCEAGYRSGDLVLSVRREASSVLAVAGVRGCATAATRTIRPSTLEPLSLSDRYTLVQKAALTAARAARSLCGSDVSDLIDTAGLVRVVPGQIY